ncbi:MAG: hypothetical protein E7198_02590 [Schwartzia succinivorans]|uniref:AAA family ATPase n=1 Tax=Schwartzia succinivorans TaxID=55507 RepID=UPI002355B743|nr:AAA family ATPase [Schwartzia succinivorans]MBE6096667.1 hypothetical protein [Schwartzia succinivorans]
MISIQFEKLFGRFDYEVILNQEGLTILTGPNGYGKSTILKSIEAIGKGIEGINYFWLLEFKKIIVCFEEGESLVIEKNENLLIINGEQIDWNRLKRKVTRNIERAPYFARLDEDTWVDRRNRIVYSDDEYVGMCLKEHTDNILPTKVVELLKTMKRSLGEVYFIKEQRLIRENRSRRFEQEIVNIIDELPKKFRDLIGEVQQNYSSKSNDLDSSYPYRLFENDAKITVAEYNQKMEAMKEKFAKMGKYDLSTTQATGNLVFKEEHAKALKVYFDDFDAKYSVYEDFIHKLELYTDIINDRLSFKSIKISRISGVEVIDAQGKGIKLNQLSSGEKQEIVLFYELIFGTPQNVLLMIDEPEISLHILWQKKFMDDLLRIIEYKNINVIVATHSPQIINNHWERQIDLGDLYGQQLNKK